VRAITFAVTSVHKGRLVFIDVRDGIMGGESAMNPVPCEFTVRVFLLPVSLPVRSRYYSRFQLQLNLTQSPCWEQKMLYRQRDSSLHHTLSSSIALSLDGSSKARALASLDRRRATTLIPEQPKPRRPMTVMVVPNLRFSVGMALAGLAQFREAEIHKPQV